MHAVIVFKTQRWKQKWPFLVEVSRDCAKTIFTKSRWGENRYSKDDIAYLLFETADEAKTSFDRLKRVCKMDEVKALKDEADAAESRAEEMLLDIVTGPAWIQAT